MMNWTTPLPKSLKELISGWPTNQYYGIYSKLWNISPSILIWEIWKERNRRIFKNQELQVVELQRKIEASIMETLNAHIRKSQFEEGSFSAWDGSIKNKWVNIINPPQFYKARNKEARVNCKWSPPPVGWVKLNFDGASRGNPGPTGIGCIINNEEGN
jgi:hypothetical protein